MWYVEKKNFLMELFNERLGESDYVMMDCSFGGGVFLIFLAGNQHVAKALVFRPLDGVAEQDVVQWYVYMSTKKYLL